MEKAIVTLTPYESRRLIGKAVANLEEVKNALKHGYVVLATSISTAYVAEEILGRKMKRGEFTIGVCAEGRLCLTPLERKPSPIVIYKGKVLKDAGYEVTKEFGPDDVFVKGGNAIDPEGSVGIFVASESGGTIGTVIGRLLARGSKIVVPIGLEKLVPYPIEFVSRVTGIRNYKYGTGAYVSLFPLPRAIPITEIEAYRILAGVSAYPIGAGGVSGSEGSITLVLEGDPESLKKAWELTSEIKGEERVKVELQDCSSCPIPCGRKSK